MQHGCGSRGVVEFVGTGIRPAGVAWAVFAGDVARGGSADGDVSAFAATEKYLGAGDACGVLETSGVGDIGGETRGTVCAAREELVSPACGGKDGYGGVARGFGVARSDACAVAGGGGGIAGKEVGEGAGAGMADAHRADWRRRDARCLSRGAGAIAEAPRAGEGERLAVAATATA